MVDVLSPVSLLDPESCGSPAGKTTLVQFTPEVQLLNRVERRVDYLSFGFSGSNRRNKGKRPENRAIMP